MSPVKFSNLFFPVWNFMRSLKFYKTIFGQSLEIRLFCRKLKSRKRRNSSSVFHRNYHKLQQRSEVNSTETNFMARETQESRDSSPLQCHSYKQSSKLSQLQNNQLNLLTATFLAKPALFGWWKTKTGKRLTITANFQEGKKKFP